MAATFRTVVALFALLPALAFAQLTYTVTTIADEGPGSLRQAILDANATAAGPTITIAFGIPGAGPHTISPATQLPAIGRADVTIDGYTQPGSSPNTFALGQNNAAIAIRLDGSSAIPNGLTVARGVAGVTIRGLSITRFNFAAYVQDNTVFGGAGNTRLVGNWIGLAPDGAPLPSQRAAYLYNALATIGLAGPENQNLIVSTNWAVEALGLGRGTFVNNAFGMKPDGTPFPANAGIFGNSPVLLGASTVCCPGLPFTASHDVGSTTDGGNVFAAMSGPVMQAGPGATFLGNRVVSPAVDVLLLASPEPRPTLTGVTFGNGSTGVTGTFAGGATSQDVRLEFHATVAPDPNQRGAADTFLGAFVVTADAGGAGSFNTLIVGDWRNLGVWKTPLTNFGTSLPATFVGPSLAASPSPVALAAQVGGTASQTVTITNGGTSFVTFGTLGIAGAGLTLANDTCSGQTVSGSGGTCSIQVNFTPGATGPVDGSLSAPIAGAGSPVTTTIPSVFVTDIDATGTPPTLPLVVTPIGTGDGTVTGTPPPAIACTRAGGANSGTCAASHPPGTVVTLTASPASGSSFAFWSGDCSGSSPTCQVTLDAAKGVSAAFVTGGVISGTPVLISVSAPDTVPVGTPLTVTATLVATPPGAIDGSVTFFNGGTALCTSVQPVVGNSAACTVTPTSTTPLAVWATYSGSPTYLPAQSIPRAVDVVGGGATIAIDFGTVTVGGESAPRTVLVGNPTAATLALTALATTGDFVAPNPCPAFLAAGETCAVPVTFRPSAAGPRTGAFEANTLPAYASAQVALAGTGFDPSFAPRLTASTTTIAFGSVAVGGSSTLPRLVTVTNEGTSAALDFAAMVPAPFRVTNLCPTVLPAGGSCSLFVAFWPTALGPASTNLVVSAGNGAGDIRIAVFGSGVSAESQPGFPMQALGSPVTATPGIAVAVQVRVYTFEQGCTLDGQFRAGRCEERCERTVRNPNGLGTTTNIYSGSCADNATICLGFGVSCLNITSGQPTSRQVPVPQTRVDWQVIGSNNSAGCALSASSTSTGQDGIAAVQVTSAVGGECLIEARTGSGPSSTAVTAIVESRIDQSRVDFLECQGVTPVTGLAYEVAQAALTLDTAFVVADANLVPVQGARLQVIVVDPARQTISSQTGVISDAGGRASHSLAVGNRAAGDVLVRATLEGTTLGAECRVRIRQSPSSLVRPADTILPSITVSSAGELVASRSGRFCARVLDGAGDPYRVSGETIDFAVPATQPTIAFARPSSFDLITDATGTACTPAATIALAKPTDPFDFTVTARYSGTSPPLTLDYRLASVTVNTSSATDGERTMRSSNAVQTGVTGLPYPQPLCVTITQPESGTGFCPGQGFCETTVTRGVANAPVVFEVIPPPSGASVGLRAVDVTGAGTSRFETTTPPKTLASGLAGTPEYRSSGKACATAVANANTGVVHVQATSSAGTVLFTLTNVTSAPSAVTLGASTVTVAQEALSGQPVSIQVKDSAGRPIAGATVNFAVRLDQGAPGFGTPTLSRPTAATNGLGIAMTEVHVNGYPYPFRVIATTLLPAATLQAAPGMAASLENGVFEVEFLVMPLAVADPGANPQGDADQDGIPNGVEFAQGTYALDKDNDVFRDARLFTMQQYRDFLRREGDAEGIGFWVGQLESGALSRDRVIESFFDSAEFQGRIAPVARLYFAYFLRVPDYGGLDFWTGFYGSGNPLDAIANAFAQSPEFVARYGALDDTQFVTLVYRNVLGRDPDPSGLAFWVGQLAAGAFTRGQVMLGFSESAEYREAIRNEVYVTMAYQGMLRREADPSGFAFWVGTMDAGNTGRALLNGFLNAPEYRTRFLP